MCQLRIHGEVEHLGSLESTKNVRVARDTASSNSSTSFMLSKLPAQLNLHECMLTHEPIVKFKPQHIYISIEKVWPPSFFPLFLLFWSLDLLFHFRIGYPLYEVKRFLDENNKSLKFVMLYDIACILSSHMKVNIFFVVVIVVFYY